MFMTEARCCVLNFGGVYSVIGYGILEHASAYVEIWDIESFLKKFPRFFGKKRKNLVIFALNGMESANVTQLV